MNGIRIEEDFLGPVEVPADRYWGAQTQRALLNFKIGCERMPRALIRALAIVKLCAAQSNMKLGNLDATLGNAIIDAARSVIGGELDDEFPLLVWQSGSGTQCNMNMNEVVANLANERLGGRRGGKTPVHPNDHCNLGQSTNDSFPTAMHIAATEQIHSVLLPALKYLADTLADKSRAWEGIIKIGRTHLQDATPLTLGQEFSGYAAQVQLGIERTADGLKHLYPLAQGGTAVGTGINTSAAFAGMFAGQAAEFTDLPFTSNSNKFEALAAHDAMVEISGVLNTLAVSLNKIANDIRLLGSGPRAGIGELLLPENEPGSSIMPGKVNPSQCEALTMVCTQVMGNHVTVTIAGSQGHLELNVFKPVIAYNVFQSIRLLGDAISSFTDNCVTGLEPDTRRIKQYVDNSLMIVTMLAPTIGYDKAARIARLAKNNGTTIREETLKDGCMTAEEYNAVVTYENMTHPSDAGKP